MLSKIIAFSLASLIFYGVLSVANMFISPDLSYNWGFVGAAVVAWKVG